MTDKEKKLAQEKAYRMLDTAGIVVSTKERIEVCDYNLGCLDIIGTEIVIYVNTDRCCAKELILFPDQICPEHIHPPIGDYIGKEETFRCRWGEVYLYIPGEKTTNPKGHVPENRKNNFTVWNEILLKPGEQYTLKENTLHWFQAGSNGAIVSEFSTKSFDNLDIFTDEEITRVGKY